MPYSHTVTIEYFVKYNHIHCLMIKHVLGTTNIIFVGPITQLSKNFDKFVQYFCKVEDLFKIFIISKTYLRALSKNIKN